MSGALRATIVIDYQNVHLTGHGLFDSTKALPKHETLVDPLLFSNTLVRVRNQNQRSDMPAAELRRVSQTATLGTVPPQRRARWFSAVT